MAKLFNNDKARYSEELLAAVEEVKNYKDQLITNRIKARKRLEQLEKELEEMNTQYISQATEDNEDEYFSKLKDKHTEIASVKQIANYQVYPSLLAKKDQVDFNTLFTQAKPEYERYSDDLENEIKAIREKLEQQKRKAQEEIDMLEQQKRSHKFLIAQAKHDALLQEMRVMRDKENK